MLYSASQLIGKTIVLEKACNVYKVIDVNNFGDLAKPAYVMQRNGTFVIDSFLAPTPGYTDPIYNITYAARTVPYFTFFAGGVYMCIAVVGDGRFSISDLRDQGALSVAEQIAKDERDHNTALQNFFNDMGTPLTILLLAGAGFLIYRTVKKK